MFYELCGVMFLLSVLITKYPKNACFLVHFRDEIILENNLMSRFCRNFFQIRQLAVQSRMSKSFFVTRNYPNKYFESLSSKYQMEMWEKEDNIPREEFLKRSKGKDGLLVSSTDRIDDELLDAAGENLKVISTVSVGYDHIDVEACKKRGVALGNTPGVLTDAMAELTIALTLATIRRFHESSRALYNGEWYSGWNHFWMCGSSIKGSVVGFVGAGRIGSAIMKRLIGFEPSKILYNTRNKNESIEKNFGAQYVSLSEVCSQSDIIIVICSLNPSTQNLISTEQFNLMKPTAVFINTSRGSVVDQDALYNALANKKIFSAGLDVMKVEPIPADDPLAKLPNVLLVPHIGSAVTSTRENMLHLAIENLLCGLEGRPLRASIY